MQTRPSPGAAPGPTWPYLALAAFDERWRGQRISVFRGSLLDEVRELAGWLAGLRARLARAPGRYRARPRKLTPAQEAAICALAATRSLRELAADFGVSHETIRAVCRRLRWVG